MLSAIDVANFFVDMANNNPYDFMTNLRVNKFLYFSQAWSLVRRRKPLFEEDVQAWQYGPVVPSVYQAFRPCGRDRISAVSGEYDVTAFASDEIELLIDVLNEYGKYSTSMLVSMTHDPGTPWDEVYAADENRTITKEQLKNHFSTLPPLPTFSASDNPNIEIVSTLPKEWYDPNEDAEWEEQG